MESKREAASSQIIPAKRRRRISLETKLDIVKLKATGEKTSVIAREFGLPSSTVATIVKNPDIVKKIAQASISVGSSRNIPSCRDWMMEEMEKMLNVWIQDQNARHCPLSIAVIQENARTIWQQLKELDDLYDDNDDLNITLETFVASREWFERFRKQYNLHSLTMTRDDPSVDTAAAEIYPKELKDIIDVGGYCPQQVFNFDATSLNWKKMPDCTHTSCFETPLKSDKDRLTLVLGGNASGDFKLKPCLIYSSENPRALKGLSKVSLPVYYMSNAKAWMTGTICYDYMKGYAGHAVAEYLEKQNLDNKALFILRNAPCHPESILDACSNIKVIFLPTNTSSLLQPMDEGVFSTFKLYYMHHLLRHITDESEKDKSKTPNDIWRKYSIKDAMFNIADSWAQVKESTMNGAWCKLWPEIVSDYKDFTDVHSIKADIVTMAGEAGICGVDEKSVNKSLESCAKELTPEDIQELMSEQTADEAEEVCEQPIRNLNLDILREFFTKIEEAINICKENDPEMDRCVKVAQGIEQSIRCYRDLYEDKKRYSHSERFSLDNCMKSPPHPSLNSFSEHSHSQ